MGHGPIEPDAEMRQMASTMAQMFVALREEGMSDGDILLVLRSMFRQD